MPTLKHSSFEIDPNEPFKNCKLGRKQYAVALTSIVKTYKEGFVMALNNEWGAGKTTFIQMWQKHLENDGCKTVYFNAWENDFDTDPFVALLAEIQKDSRSFNTELVEAAAPIVITVASEVLRGMLKKVTGVDGKELFEAITDSGKTLLNNYLEDYNEKKKSIATFKNQLEKFVQKNTTDGKPLVFFIDELDRCKPSYAVEVLEKVKHFFSVPGIVFVLSIDKTQLINSIKGYYGSDSIDGENYLKRFIELEYSLPAPDINAFNEYLYEYYGFDDFFDHNERLSNLDLSYDKGYFLKAIRIYSSIYFNSLRTQERLFALTSVVTKSFNTKEPSYIYIVVLLIYLKFFKKDEYQNISNLKMSFLDSLKFFHEIIFNAKFSKEIKYPYRQHAEFCMLYGCSFYESNSFYDENIELSHGVLNNEIMPKEMKNTINKLLKEWVGSKTDISFTDLINRINLCSELTLQNPPTTS